jgi:hypothetical protein
MTELFTTTAVKTPNPTTQHMDGGYVEYTLVYQHILILIVHRKNVSPVQLEQGICEPGLCQRKKVFGGEM